MAGDIIYTCNSINNKNIREGELEILEKHEEELYFEFGESEMNKKKRFYNDLKTLNKDFDALLKIKNNSEKENKEEAKETIKSDEPKVEINPQTKEEIDEEIDEKISKAIKVSENLGKKRLRR